MSTTLTYDFAPSSLQDWMNIVQKDLKERPYSELTWTVDGDIILEPINDAERLSNRGMVLSQQQHNWKTAMVVSENCDNAMILSALENGVNTLIVDAFDDLARYQNLFKDVEPSYLTWIIVLTHQEQVATFHRWVGEQPVEVTFKIVDKRHIPLLEVALTTFPASKFIVGIEAKTGEYSSNLCTQMIVLDGFLREASAKKIASVENLLGRACLEAEVSRDFLVELAHLRTIQLIWKNYMNAFHVPLKDAEIIVSLDKHCLSADRNTNLIQVTTMVMSAVPGGASIIIAGAQAADEQAVDSEAFRLSSNIQMMLKMESYFDKVADPYAGSYFVENLTQKLATKVWSLLKTKLHA